MCAGVLVWDFSPVLTPVSSLLKNHLNRFKRFTLRMLKIVSFLTALWNTWHECRGVCFISSVAYVCFVLLNRRRRTIKLRWEQYTSIRLTFMYFKTGNVFSCPFKYIWQYILAFEGKKKKRLSYCMSFRIRKHENKRRLVPVFMTMHHPFRRKWTLK